MLLINKVKRRFQLVIYMVEMLALEKRGKMPTPFVERLSGKILEKKLSPAELDSIKLLLRAADKFEDSGFSTHWHLMEAGRTELGRDLVRDMAEFRSGDYPTLEYLERFREMVGPCVNANGGIAQP